MVEPLETFRRLAPQPADAVRWACVLEAMSPKAGNVYPGQPFGDLTHQDFVAAAEITAKQLGRREHPISERMRRSVFQTVAQTGTNVNLGIVLLLGPLVAADESMDGQSGHPRRRQHWIDAVASVLRSFDGDDGSRVFAAIGASSAGGLGNVDEMDVHDVRGPVDLVAAMQLAQQRDRIAMQYATDFADLIDNIAPVLQRSIDHCGDVLAGIGQAHLRLLSLAPDSLIARKNGLPVAVDVQRRAAQVDVTDPVLIWQFDQSLRDPSHRLNPGTTADLIAAALYLLLRSDRQTFFDR